MGSFPRVFKGQNKRICTELACSNCPFHLIQSRRRFCADGHMGFSSIPLQREGQSETHPAAKEAGLEGGLLVQDDTAGMAEAGSSWLMPDVGMLRCWLHPGRDWRENKDDKGCSWGCREGRACKTSQLGLCPSQMPQRAQWDPALPLLA